MRFLAEPRPAPLYNQEISRLIAASLTAILILLGVRSAFADMITIEAGATAPAGSTAANTAMPNVNATAFQNQVFKSSAWPNGSLITNYSGMPIKDLEITLTSDDTFAKGISGGTAFPTVTYSADMKTVTFSGGNIPSVPAGQAAKAENKFWLKIPLSADYAGGRGKYKGNATPVPPPPKPEKKKSTVPEAGNSPSSGPKLRVNANNDPAQITYNAATHSFQFSPGAVNFVEYRNGTVVTANSASESIIGANIQLDPTSVIGPSPDVPGAFQIGDSYLVIARDLQNPTENVFLSGALLDLLLIPQPSGSAFDSVLQATISLQEAGTGLGSSFVDQFLTPVSGGGFQLDFETNLLSATNGLTQSGSSTGLLLVNLTIPEPSTALLFPAAALCLAAYTHLTLRRRLKRS